MVDRPILFSAAMVRALLAGRKTQTRRIIDFPGIDKVIDFVRVAFDKDTGVPIYEMKDAGGVFVTRPAGKHFVDYHYSPRFAVGDRLWAREAWRVSSKWNVTAPRDLPARTMTTFFEVGGGSMGGIERCPTDRVRTADEYPFDPTYPPVMPDWAGRKRAGMHMPRWASRLTLTVTDVRVQRLQEISEADARAEGCPLTWDGKPYDPPPPDVDSWQGYGRYSYCLLWNKLNASRGFGWEANPWIVAVTFTVERRNIDAVAP